MPTVAEENESASLRCVDASWAFSIGLLIESRDLTPTSDCVGRELLFAIEGDTISPTVERGT
jgi:hypothetical protein